MQIREAIEFNPVTCNIFWKFIFHTWLEQLSIIISILWVIGCRGAPALSLCLSVFKTEYLTLDYPRVILPSSKHHPDIIIQRGHQRVSEGPLNCTPSVKGHKLKVLKIGYKPARTISQLFYNKGRGVIKEYHSFMRSIFKNKSLSLFICAKEISFRSLRTLHLVHSNRQFQKHPPSTVRMKPVTMQNSRPIFHPRSRLAWKWNPIRLVGPRRYINILSSPVP